MSAMPRLDNSPSVAAPAGSVGAQCKGLAEKIAAVPAGTPFQSLAQEFNQHCAGIAYECIAYRGDPSKNRCGFIVRKGGTIVSNKSYP